MANPNTYVGGILNSGKQNNVYDPYDPYSNKPIQPIVNLPTVSNATPSVASAVAPLSYGDYSNKDYSKMGTTFGPEGAPSLGKSAAEEAAGGGLASIAKFAGPIAAGVGAVTSIIDTITGIYATNKAVEESKKNREMATKQYNEQKAAYEEEKNYNRGIAERTWNYDVKQNVENRALAKKEDNYQKWNDFIKRYTMFLNENTDIRQNLINNYRANSRLA